MKKTSESIVRNECVPVKDAAEMLGLSRVRVQELVLQGRFNGAFQIGRTWLIPRESVENYKPLPRGRQPKPKREQGERANGEKFAAMLNNMELSGDA